MGSEASVDRWNRVLGDPPQSWEPLWWDGFRPRVGVNPMGDAPIPGAPTPSGISPVWALGSDR